MRCGSRPEEEISVAYAVNKVFLDTREDVSAEVLGSQALREATLPRRVG